MKKGDLAKKLRGVEPRGGVRVFTDEVLAEVDNMRDLGYSWRQINNALFALGATANEEPAGVYAAHKRWVERNRK